MAAKPEHDDIDVEIEKVKARTRKCAEEIMEIAEKTSDPESVNGILHHVEQTLVAARKKEKEVKSGVIQVRK